MRNDNAWKTAVFQGNPFSKGETNAHGGKQAWLVQVWGCLLPPSCCQALSAGQPRRMPRRAKPPHACPVSSREPRCPPPLFLKNPASQFTILSVGTLVLDSLSPLPRHLSPQPHWALLGPWLAASKAREHLEVRQVSNWKRKERRTRRYTVSILCKL